MPLDSTIKLHLWGGVKEPYSHLMQEQPTLEIVSVGLATHATSSSKRSFSMVLIMLSYLMSTGRSKKVLGVKRENVTAISGQRRKAK